MLQIEKEFVHKTKDENVLVCNIRRKLPREIRKDIFEGKLLPSIIEKNKEKLRNDFIQKNINFIFGKDDINCLNRNIFLFHFTKVKKKFEDLFDTTVFFSMKEKEKDFLSAYYQCDGKFYRYHEAPCQVSSNEHETIISRLNQEQAGFFNSMYSPDEKNELFILRDQITEIDESKLIEIIKKQNLWINDHDKAHLSELLDNCQELERENDFFANIRIDTSHPFFFEHPNEHVPGLLMIEGVRQFLLACSHKYGNIPLEGATIVLQDLSVNFTEYLELYSPVLVRSIGKNAQYNKYGYWSLYETDIEIYQNNKLKGTMRVKASSIPIKLFKRFRHTNEIADNKARYIPREKNKISMMLNMNGNPAFCRLRDISCFDFGLEFPEQFQIDMESNIDFYLYQDNIGLIHGQCQCRRTEHDKMHSVDVGGFQITQISESDISFMADFIKRYCTINRDREIFEKKKRYKVYRETEQAYASRS